MDVTSQYDIAAGRAANASDGAAPRDCLLVLIGSSGYDIDLIHAGKRLAEAVHAVWAVVDVETSRFRFMPDRDRARRLEILRIAESLGAEAVTLHGATAATTIAAYARLRQASKILVGSPTRLGWLAISQYARLAALKRLSPGIEIIAIAARSGSAPAPGQVPRMPARRRGEQFRRRVRDYLSAVAVTAICTAIS